MGNSLRELIQRTIEGYFVGHQTYSLSNEHPMVDEQMRQIANNILREANTIDQRMEANYARIRATNLAKKQAEIQAKNNPQLRQSGNVDVF